MGPPGEDFEPPSTTALHQTGAFRGPSTFLQPHISPLPSGGRARDWPFGEVKADQA